MARSIEILLEQRGIRAVAELMEADAPRTCEAVWNALPQSGSVWHAKFANNEIFILTEPFASEEPGRENGTVFPIPGDLLYFFIPPGTPVPAEVKDRAAHGLVDLAVFYGRNNYLHGPEGFMPGNLFATITEGLQELAAASYDIWRNGGASETMTFRRLEE